MRLAGARAGFVPKQERARCRGQPQVRAIVCMCSPRSRVRLSCVSVCGNAARPATRCEAAAEDKDPTSRSGWKTSLAVRLLLHGAVSAHRRAAVRHISTYVDQRSGTSVDLFGLRRDRCASVWRRRLLYGKPPSHQRLLVLPWFKLVPQAPLGSVWWPPTPIICSLRCTVRTGARRNPNGPRRCRIPVQETNLGWRCWALKNLCQSWLGGDLPRTRRLLVQISTRAGEDAQLRGWHEALEAGPAA